MKRSRRKKGMRMSYSYNLRPKFRFYKEEVRDIILAVGVLTLAFTFLISGFPFYSITTMDFLVAFLSVITAFFLHEMGHKYLAFRYGYPAAFRAWRTGLLIALISGFFGFLFAAPGAVYIYGYPTREENGKISAVGPATNIVAGFAFLLLAHIIGGVWGYVSVYIAGLNFFLAFFNLLPIGPMDGLKIFRWSVAVYFSLFVLSIAGLFLTYW